MFLISERRLCDQESSTIQSHHFLPSYKYYSPSRMHWNEGIQIVVKESKTSKITTWGAWAVEPELQPKSQTSYKVHYRGNLNGCARKEGYLYV